VKRSIIAAVLVAVPVCVSFGQVPDLFAQAGPIQSASTKYIKATAVPSLLQATPGGRFYVALELHIADGWVYYSPDPGPVVLPGELKVDAGKLTAGRPLWPKDKRKTVSLGDQELVNNVYTKQAYVYVPIAVPPDTPHGAFEITITVEGQVCKDVCINLEGVQAGASINVGPAETANLAWTGELAAGLEEAMTVAELRAWHGEATNPSQPTSLGGGAVAKTVWAGLGLALLAGLTLNIMPCVLPVIPLRILSIVGMARESRRRFVTLGLAFAAGIVLFFAAIAVVNATLRAATGQAVNVSDHFTYPGVRIAIAMVLIALAANLFCAFTVVVPSKVAALEDRARREGHLKSLGMGFMMAVLATPCSFAYLLAAMAWAQVQPLWLATAAIVTIGIGMAAPHVLLAAFPDLLGKLPRPGRWTEIFKQSMGFLLLPVAIWLISTLGAETWPFWVAAYGVVLAFALWMWGSWLRFDAPLGRKLIVRGLAVAIAVAGGLWMLPRPQPPAIAFEKFDESLIEAGRNDGRIVLVKVTASWCTECLVIDHTVYNTAEIAAELARRNVLAIKADVTDRGWPASDWVRRQFGASPPLTIIYPPGADEPIILVGSFSKSELIAALDQAGRA